MDWFLYDRDLRHERVKILNNKKNSCGAIPLKIFKLFWNTISAHLANMSNDKILKSLFSGN